MEVSQCEKVTPPITGRGGSPTRPRRNGNRLATHHPICRPASPHPGVQDEIPLPGLPRRNEDRRPARQRVRFHHARRPRLPRRTAAARALHRLVPGPNRCAPPPRSASAKAKPRSPTAPSPKPSEQLGGFYLIEARDLNEALRLASEMPPARIGSIEVRALDEY
ncbi:MAG: YciI family protein [Chloroflexia bacterium]